MPSATRPRVAGSSRPSTRSTARQSMRWRCSAARRRRVLDLGAGTGMLAARVAAAYPEAELVLTRRRARDARAGPRGARRPAPRSTSRTCQPRCPTGRSTPSSPRSRSTTSTTRPSATSSRGCAPRCRPAASSSTPSRSPARRPASTAAYRAWHRGPAARARRRRRRVGRAQERMRHDQCASVEAQLRLAARRRLRRGRLPLQGPPLRGARYTARRHGATVRRAATARPDCPQDR